MVEGFAEVWQIMGHRGLNEKLNLFVGCVTAQNILKENEYVVEAVTHHPRLRFIPTI